MTKWVKMGVFVALLLTLTGVSVSWEKSAAILPPEPEDISINFDNGVRP